MEKNLIDDFWKSVESELNDNIIPFWRTQSIDFHYGGFVGRIASDGTIDRRANKGLVLNARLLWSFSALYQFTKDDTFFDLARRAYEYLTSYFWDEKFGGLFWLVDFQGYFVDDTKKTYGQAFFLYALAEYYKITKDDSILEQAIQNFNLIEDKTHDPRKKGYFEGFNRNWSTAEGLRLSDVDMNEKKSMNTHLHVLEAYTNLYRIWPNKNLESKLSELIKVFLEHIIHPQTFHFKLFFDENWQSKSEHISYGHDIEGTWLLAEAADVLGHQDLIKRTRSIILSMVQAVYQEGLDKDGALYYEGEPSGIIDTDKHWWPQVEAVIGFLNAYQLTKDENYLQASLNCWQFIEKYIVDKKNGEWFWRVSKSHKIYHEDAKASEWKSPYHNCRGCIEIMNRLDKLNL